MLLYVNVNEHRVRKALRKKNKIRDMHIRRRRISKEWSLGVWVAFNLRRLKVFMQIYTSTSFLMNKKKGKFESRYYYCSFIA